MNILVIFLISASSNVSVPTLLQYTAFQNHGGFIELLPPSQDSPPIDHDLSEGPYQYNFTLSPDVMFNGMIMSITSNTTSQWVAINRIIFCAAATEGLWSSPPLIHPTTLLYITFSHSDQRNLYENTYNLCIYVCPCTHPSGMHISRVGRYYNITVYRDMKVSQ